MKFKFITFNVSAMALYQKTGEKTEVIDFPDNLEAISDPIVTVANESFVKVSYLCRVKDQID